MNHYEQIALAQWLVCIIGFLIFGHAFHKHRISTACFTICFALYFFRAGVRSWSFGGHQASWFKYTGDHRLIILTTLAVGLTLILSYYERDQREG